MANQAKTERLENPEFLIDEASDGTKGSPMVRVNVSESYSISLPEDHACQYDDGVWSYWRPGSDAALQLSSRLRTRGGPLDARDRFQQHLAKAGISDAKPVAVDSPSPSSAAAEFRDQSGYV